MPELSTILAEKRESDYRHHKFLAAIQGINLDDASGGAKKQTTFDDIKARVFSGGMAKDASDILSLQGINAAQAGFGIGMGLDYADSKNDEGPTNPLA